MLKGKNNEVIEYLFIGSGFAFAAAIQPGPLQAFLLSSVAKHGWRRTLPAAFSPLLSDGPIVAFMLLVLKHVPEAMGSLLRVAGGTLLFYFAWSSYRQWQQQATTGSKNRTEPRTILQAATVNILNPNPYLAWSLILGPAVLTAWRQNPVNAIVLITTFYSVMVTVLALTIILFGTTRFLGPTGRRDLILVAALILAALGVYQLATGIMIMGAK